MKKNEKIMIAFLGSILLIMIGILFFTKTVIKQNVATRVEKQNGKLVEVKQEQIKGNKKIIKVNGTLYYDTGKYSENLPRCGTLDGNITSIVKESEVPTKDGEANFEGARGYQHGTENTIEVPTEEGWLIFEAKGYDFYGTIKKIEKNHILVEPDEGETIRKSADLISVEINTDSSFQVRRKNKNYL